MPLLQPGSEPDEYRLDPDTGLESSLLTGGVLAILCSFMLPLPSHRSPGLIGWHTAGMIFLFGVAALILRYLLDDHYILSMKRKDLVFVRKFLGNSFRTRVCDFCDLRAVAVLPEFNQNKNRTWWEYGLVLVRHGGAPVHVISADHQSYEMVRASGEQLAQLLQLDFHAGQPESKLKIEGTEVRYEPHQTRSVGVVVAGVILFVTFVLVSLVIYSQV